MDAISTPFLTGCVFPSFLVKKKAVGSPLVSIPWGHTLCLAFCAAADWHISPRNIYITPRTATGTRFTFFLIKLETKELQGLEGFESEYFHGAQHSLSCPSSVGELGMFWEKTSTDEQRSHGPKLTVMQRNWVLVKSALVWNTLGRQECGCWANFGCVSSVDCVRLFLYEGSTRPCASAISGIYHNVVKNW